MDLHNAQAIRSSFEGQSALATLGASLVLVDRGFVEVALHRFDHVKQQNGFLHGGIVATLMDTACGYAAMTMAPAGANVLTVEFKLNFLSPAAGAGFRALGRVKRAGRTVSVCDGELVARDESGAEKVVAVMLATIMTVAAR